MKLLNTLILAASLTPVVAIASDDGINTVCESTTLETSNRSIEVSVSKDGALNSNGALQVDAYANDNGEAVAVNGLKADILKTNLVDVYSRDNCGWGCYHYESKVYAVKVEFRALESIGIEIQGDVGMPVKEKTAYLICTQTKVTAVRHLLN